MKKEQLELLKDYIKINMSPLLIPSLLKEYFKNTILLKNDIDRKELNGHYEGMEFTPPIWYQELIQKSKNNDYVILMIENINEISKEEQMKFIEILKYKKISTFDLPKNCIIIATYNHLKEKTIAEEVYSLFIQI